jgi:hypothetical protein
LRSVLGNRSAVVSFSSRSVSITSVLQFIIFIPQSGSPVFGMPPPSSAERLAAHWVADALAADEAIHFSVIKSKLQALIACVARSVLLLSFVLSPRVPDAPPALVDLSPEYLIGAPDSVRERVALRGLEEHATVADADEGDAAVAPPPSKILRVDAVRSCEDLLVELTEQVFSAYATMCIFVV